MRADIVRLYRQVHSWTGILTGLILFVCFYAGAVTMFKEPLERWMTRPEAVSPMALDGAGELIAATRALRPEVRDFTLALDPVLAGEAPLRLTWTEERIDPAPWAATLGPDGSVTVDRLDPAGIGLLVDVLHRTAGIPGDLDIGTLVTGIASALYVVALVSGVIVLLPSLVKDFLVLRVTANLKRMWLDVHNVLGIVSLPFHIVIALSAVVFGLHDQIYDALDEVVYDGRMRTVIAASSPFRGVRKDTGPAAMLAPQAFLERVHALEPGFTPTSLEYHDAGTRAATVRVWGHDPRYLVRREGFVLLGATDGRVIDTEYMPGHQGPWSSTVSAFFALHFGSFGGGVVRWTYFLLGLAGALLFYTGNLLWIESRRRTERRAGGPVAQSRSTSLLAAGTVGVCLGCVGGLSSTIAAGKWLNGLVDDLHAWHWGIYYVTFLAACIWAFLRGAARAGVELLWASAAASAAIPATSLLGWVVPGLGLWASPGLIGVDLVALAGALALASMARRTARRAQSGPQDSVWATSASTACPGRSSSLAGSEVDSVAISQPRTSEMEG
ncbi:peptidase [Azospirillum thiophilum]|uniref:Peptidase n=1 Tax=Azospirillum thiophilum TaxID=528244 RepID=A0AAC8W059_9PROT|nr:PepSY-associated TM helix domain-containing protein [Azospirillum thiophilum]ALG72587.1 peptidase [Azospirillum thiophilum]KJR64495.1 peptidase [Azospirillum thiophilum]